MSRNDTTTPLSAIIKTIQWLPCVIWPDMLNTHATEFIYFTFYAHVLYAMLVLFCQRLLTNSMKLYSIEIYMYAFSLWIACDISMYSFYFGHCVLWFMDSDYPLGIFKLFFLFYISVAVIGGILYFCWYNTPYWLVLLCCDWPVYGMRGYLTIANVFGVVSQSRSKHLKEWETT